MSSRAALFDLDGTLHDREAGVRAFLAAQHRHLELAQRGIPLDRWTERFLHLEESGRVWKDVVYAQLVEEFALPLAADAMLADYEKGFPRHVVPFEGLKGTLTSLRSAGWRTGLVTNGRSAFQRATLAALGIGALLDVVVISEECGRRKPDPQIFERALRALGCPAEGSWFVGDDPIADVEGARRAGMRAVLFPGEVDRLENLIPLFGQPISSRRLSGDL